MSAPKNKLCSADAARRAFNEATLALARKTICGATTSRAEVLLAALVDELSILKENSISKSAADALRYAIDTCIALDIVVIVAAKE